MSKVLIVDDEESICWGLSQLCESMALSHEIASSAEAGLEKAGSDKFDVVILDVSLPGMSGLQAIPLFREKLGTAPIITITAFGDLQTAIQAVKNGAFEYIVKPFDLESVKRKINQAVAVAQMQPDRDSKAETDAEGEPGLVGSSPVMQEVFKQIALTTTSNSPVLITGESGTGKELTARSIHRFGSRSDGPFIPVNIAALNLGIAESELFGHTKGAFTGADNDRKGLIEQSSGGTLFLDEVAEIPVSIQVKLLRVLDQQEVTPVGSSTPIKTDFRLISATNQDLLSQVNHGDFRHDLFYRLRTFEICLPPLRQRADDIPALVNCFLRKGSSENIVATKDAMAALMKRSWPGNVRELQSVVDRAAAQARAAGFLTPAHLNEEEPPVPVADQKQDRTEVREFVESWLEDHWESEGNDGLYEKFFADIEPILLPKAFELSGRQYSAAARKLGIHRTTLKKKLDDIEED